MIKKILFKKLTFLETVSILLAFVVLICLLNPGSLGFFCLIYSLLGASFLVLIYTAIRWQRLDRNARAGGILSILVWLAMAYCFIHAEGLTVSVFFMP